MPLPGASEADKRRGAGEEEEEEEKTKGEKSTGKSEDRQEEELIDLVSSSSSSSDGGNSDDDSFAPIHLQVGGAGAGERGGEVEESMDINLVCLISDEEADEKEGDVDELASSPSSNNHTAQLNHAPAAAAAARQRDHAASYKRNEDDDAIFSFDWRTCSQDSMGIPESPVRWALSTVDEVHRHAQSSSQSPVVPSSASSSSSQSSLERPSKRARCNSVEENKQSQKVWNNDARQRKRQAKESAALQTKIARLQGQISRGKNKENEIQAHIEASLGQSHCIKVYNGFLENPERPKAVVGIPNNAPQGLVYFALRASVVNDEELKIESGEEVCILPFCNVIIGGAQYLEFVNSGQESFLLNMAKRAKTFLQTQGAPEPIRFFFLVASFDLDGANRVQLGLAITKLAERHGIETIQAQSEQGLGSALFELHKELEYKPYRKKASSISILHKYGSSADAGAGAGRCV